MEFKRVLIKLGIHGKRHRISRLFLNIESYNKKYNIRLEVLLKEMHDTGVGV